MSVVTGSKGEKGTKKFQSLNINNLYQGSALKPLQKSIPQKHGLQSLGKVPTARRAPANLPSLKAEHSGNDPTINLVPSSHGLTGGWTANSKEEPDAQKANPTKNDGSATIVPGNSAAPSAGSAPGNNFQSSLSSKSTWGAASTKPPGGPQSNSGGAFLSQRSPLFGQEFPSLTGGNAEGASAATSDPNAPSPPPGGNKGESKYGPGPSLRPQSFATWSFSGKQQQQSNNHDKDATFSAVSGGSSGGQDKSNYDNRTRTLPETGGLKFDVGVNSPLLQQPPFSGRKSTPLRSQPVLVNKPTHPPQSRPREKVFQGSIIDNEKLKRMDDIDSTDDDWTKRDESFDYNKKIASDDEDDYPINERSHNNWTDQLANRHSEPKDNYEPKQPNYSQMGNRSGLKVDSHLSFLDDEDQRRTKKNEEVLKNIERARRRRAEEEQKYRIVDDYGSQFSNEYHNRRNSPGTAYENGVSKSASGTFGKFDVGAAESDDYDSEPKKPVNDVVQPPMQQPSRGPKQSSVPPRFKRHGVELHSYKRVSPPKEQRGGQHFEDVDSLRSSASRDSGENQSQEKDYGALFRQQSSSGPNSNGATGWGMRHQSGSSDSRMQSEDKFEEPSVSLVNENDKKASPPVGQENDDEGSHFTRGSGTRLSSSKNNRNNRVDNKHDESKQQQQQQHKKPPENNSSTKERGVGRGGDQQKQQSSQKGERGQRGSQRGGHNALPSKGHDISKRTSEHKAAPNRGQRGGQRKDEEPATEIQAVHGQKQNNRHEPNEEEASPTTPFETPSGDHESVGWFAPRGQPSRRGRGGLVIAGDTRGNSRPDHDHKWETSIRAGHKSQHHEDWDETSSELSAGQNDDQPRNNRRGEGRSGHGQRRDKPNNKKVGKNNEHGDEPRRNNDHLDSNDQDGTNRNNRRPGGDRGAVRPGGKHEEKDRRGGVQPDLRDRRDRGDRIDRDKQNTYERRQNKLPPRLAKQKEQNRFSGGSGHANHNDAWGAPASSEIDSSIPPPVGGGVQWDHQVLSHSPYGLSGIQQQVNMAANSMADYETNRAMLMHRFRSDDGSIATDSLAGLPASGLSTNMGEAFAAESRENAVQTIIFENTNFKGARPGAPPSSGEGEKLMFKLSAANAEKAGLGFGQTKVEDDLKLDFTFETDDISGHGDDKESSKAGHRSVPSSSGVSTVSTSQPASADDLNMKIASVKKVWETLPSMSPVPGTATGADPSASAGIGPFSSSEDKAFESANNGFIDKDTSGASNIAKVRPQQQSQSQGQQQQSSHHQTQQPLQQVLQHQVVHSQLQQHSGQLHHAHQGLLQQQASGLDDRMLGRGNNINYNRLLGSSGLANLQSPPSILGQQPSLYQAFQIDPSRGVTNQLYSYPPTGMGGQSLIMPPSGSSMNAGNTGGNTDIFGTPPNNQFGRQFTGPPPNAAQPSTVAGLMSQSSLMSNAMKQSVVTSGGIGPIGTKGGQMNAYQQSGLGSLPGSGTSLLIPYDGGFGAAMQRSAAGQTAFYQTIASRTNNFGMAGYPNQQSLVQQQMMRNAAAAAAPGPMTNHYMKPDVTSNQLKSSGNQQRGSNDPYGSLQGRQFSSAPNTAGVSGNGTQQQQAAVKATAVSLASMSLRVGSGATTNGTAPTSAAAVQPSTSYSPTPIQRPPGGKGKQVLSSEGADEAAPPPVNIDVSGINDQNKAPNDDE